MTWLLHLTFHTSDPYWFMSLYDIVKNRGPTRSFFPFIISPPNPLLLPFQFPQIVKYTKKVKIQSRPLHALLSTKIFTLTMLMIIEIHKHYFPLPFLGLYILESQVLTITTSNTINTYIFLLLEKQNTFNLTNIKWLRSSNQHIRPTAT